MEYQEYLENKKELYDIFLQFVENDEDEEEDFKYHQLIDFLEKLIGDDREDMILFLRLLVQISNNHHRQPNFFQKIEKVLNYLLQSIKQTFTNLEIYEIFKSNKLIVLYFIEHEIINVDEEIANLIFYRSQKTNTKYHHFFYPEIKNFLDVQEVKNIENEIDKEDCASFENLRKTGENEKYLCELIRKDSIIQFVKLMNENVSLNKMTINPSIFETNLFLTKNEASLIEYAAFYGSIQIFQYLKLNQHEMKPSLWLYAIHSNNPELIHILEESNVEPPDGSFESCLVESIKCHHNEIANYIKQVIFNDNKINFIYKPVFQYCNYNQMPNEFEGKHVFYYLCRYNYSNLVELYLRSKQENILITENIIFFLLIDYDV